MPQQPESELITKAMAGDRQAFSQLVASNQGYLYAIAYRYLSNEDEAEDAVQETFVKLWKNFSKYREEVKLTTWLYRILVNHCLDIKKSSVSRFQNHRMSIEKAANFSTGSTPHLEMEKKEIACLLQQAVDELRGKQKMVFVLRDMEGLEVGEVCNLMELSEEQMKSNLYHARQKVQDWMKKNCEQD